MPASGKALFGSGTTFFINIIRDIIDTADLFMVIYSDMDTTQ